MHIRRSIVGAALGASVLVVAFVGTAAGRAPSARGQFQAQLALQQLQSDFHGANTMADYDLMKSIWTENAVFNGPSGPIVGPTAIANFFAAGPRWGKTASLAPTYKTQYAIQGNEAQLQFECILVDTGGKSPLATTLSTVPFGGQAPGVTIVQHSTARVVAVKRGNRWLIRSFTGAAGPQ